MGAFAAAVVLVLREAGLSCDVTLGLSLGEYSALHAAGVFDAQTLIGLLGYRGKIMADASKEYDTNMIAVFGVAEKDVEEAVLEAAQQTGKIVACTNYNCPGQVVIGGQSDAVAAAQALIRKRGAKRFITLKTSGPFHTSLMNDASKLLAQRLEQTDLQPQHTPVIFNATAQFASDAEIPALLARQVASPVLFAQSLRNLAFAGVNSIIEIGPGRVIAGLVRKTIPDIEVFSIQNAADLKEVIKR